MPAQAITSHDINALTGKTYPEIESGVPSLLPVLWRLAAWYQRNRMYRKTVSELGRLSDHVLADVAIERHQIGERARALNRRTA